jgi:hypothetical protein
LKRGLKWRFPLLHAHVLPYKLISEFKISKFPLIGDSFKYSN